jgi:hypothetical protein
MNLWRNCFNFQVNAFNTTGLATQGRNVTATLDTLDSSARKFRLSTLKWVFCISYCWLNGAKAFIIMTLSLTIKWCNTTFSIMALFATLSITGIKWQVPLCWVSHFFYCYAECRGANKTSSAKLYNIPIMVWVEAQENSSDSNCFTLQMW